MTARGESFPVAQGVVSHLAELTASNRFLRSGGGAGLGDQGCPGCDDGQDDVEQEAMEGEHGSGHRFATISAVVKKSWTQLRKNSVGSINPCRSSSVFVSAGDVPATPSQKRSQISSARRCASSPSTPSSGTSRAAPYP